MAHTHAIPCSDMELTVEDLGQTMLTIFSQIPGGIDQFRRILNHATPSPVSHGTASLRTSARNKLQEIARPFLDEMTASTTIPLSDQPSFSQLQSDPYFTNTSLGKALYQDDVEVFQALRDLGLKPNSLLPCGYTILGVAIILSRDYILEHLLTVEALGVSTLVNGCNPQRNPMTLALDVERMALFRRFLLLEQDDAITSAVMMHCCQFHSAHMLAEVVSLGGNIWIVDAASKRTTLHAAVDNPDLAVLDYLLLNMHTVNFFPRWMTLGLQDLEGHTPVTKAAAAGRYQHLTRLVRVCDTRAHTENADGVTVLTYAARRLDVEMVQFLVNAGCRGMNNWVPGGNPFSSLVNAYAEIQKTGDERNESSVKKVQVILLITKILLSCNGDPFAYGGGQAQSPFSQAKKLCFEEFVEIVEEWREKTIGETVEEA
ncbi:hypothetical protein FE257_003326 [Aspergillus nanangensis]|uniref:Ankyrin n=1 Tax=Aspergillus nanangensis TaxID=2582783 RepID=A0AAD4CSC4_ASPNN|nr:hypothetical protein FE257_003326 [Aspergillus nanangensis]